MRYFDLHCDTLFRIYDEGLPFDSEKLMTSPFSRGFDSYTQVLAVWSRQRNTEKQNYEDFFRICDLLEQNRESLPENYSYLLAVEGGRLISDDIKKLDAIAEKGVKIFTLLWCDTCAIGGGHNTDKGLTPFGYKVVDRLWSLGILPDLSHASDKMFYEVAELAAKNGAPFVASHSCARSLCEVSRNLTDDMIVRLAESDALCGINLCPQFLKGDTAGIDDIVRHIKHFISLGAEGALALGCDFDGIDSTPVGISGASDMLLLYKAMLDMGISEKTANAIFYKNADSFMERHGITPKARY